MEFTHLSILHFHWVLPFIMINSSSLQESPLTPESQLDRLHCISQKSKVNVIYSSNSQENRGNSNPGAKMKSEDTGFSSTKLMGIFQAWR